MKLKILAIEWTRRAEFTNGRGNARRQQQTINKKWLLKLGSIFSTTG